MKLSEAKSRDDAWSILDGFAYEGREGLERQRTRKPLVKSYILETSPDENAQPDLSAIFNGRHATLTKIDESLYRIDSPGCDDSLGFLETFQRHPVIYTPHETKDMDPWVKKLILDTKELDSLWLSGKAFQTFLDTIFATSPGHRYGRLVFEHRSIFEQEGTSLPQSSSTEDEAEELEELDAGEDVDNDEDDVFQETRSTKFSVMDRLSHLEKKLTGLQQLYSPFYSISQLRFPAAGRGGHDFYHWGKATNRSDSFLDHRQHVQHVLEVYRASTRRAERSLWGFEEKNIVRTQGETRVVIGAPVFFRFSEPLGQATFDSFITHVFKRRANKFRLWGNPISLGPRKVHVYGLDRHLWQPIHLDITHEGSLEDMNAVVEVKGDQARLLPVAERTAYLFGKDQASTPDQTGRGKKKKAAQMDLFAELTGAEATEAEAVWEEKTVSKPGATVLDRVHQSMILFATGRGEALKRFLVEDGIGREGNFWKLAQALSALYPSGSQEKRWVDGVLARKKGLGL